MSKIGIIVKAWMKVFKGITTAEDKRKASICNECSYARHEKYIDFINDELEEVKGFVCKKCDCPLIAKIRSGENCPLNKW